jgi:hypothetical protein
MDKQALKKLVADGKAYLDEEKYAEARTRLKEPSR